MDMQGRDIDSQGGFVEPSRVPDGKFADAQGRSSVSKRAADQDGKDPDMPNFPMDFGGHYMEGQNQPFAPYMDRGYMRNMEPMDMRYMEPGRFSLHMENPERYMDLSRFTMDFEGRYMDPNGRLFYPFGRRGSNRMMDMMRPQIPRNEIGGEKIDFLNVSRLFWTLEITTLHNFLHFVALIRARFFSLPFHLYSI